jgi:hypothetical protein
MKTIQQQFRRALACAAALCCMHSAHAAGPVVFDNGPSDHFSGNNMGFALQADDFTLGSSTILDSIIFTSAEANGAYRGSIWWAVMGNDGGMPGATMLASGSQSSVLRTSLGQFGGLTEYSNSFRLNAPLSLQAGTYWLVLHNGSPTDFGDPNEFLWATSAANKSFGGFESYGPGAPWTGNFNEHAFRVSAVPEPAQLLMLLAGGAAVFGLRRRQQARGGAL